MKMFKWHLGLLIALNLTTLCLAQTSSIKKITKTSILKSNLISNTLNFEESNGTTSWEEDGLNWSWDNSSTSINSLDPHNGDSHASAFDGTNAKLTAEQPINIDGLWLKLSPAHEFTYLYIKGYNDLGTLVHSDTLNPIPFDGMGPPEENGYTYLTLDWVGIKQLQFEFESDPGGIDAVFFFDDMDYSYSTDNIAPNISCPNNFNLCLNQGLPDYRDSVDISDDSGTFEVIQSPEPGTIITESTMVTLTANDASFNMSQCEFEVIPLLPSENTLVMTVCDSTEINDQVFTASGIYTQMLTNTVGCDSVLTIDLTINQSTSSALEMTVCNSTLLNDEVFTASGIYTQMITNAVGCDSVLTIDLTVNQSTNSTMELTVCDSTELNNEVFTTSGIYSQMLTNTVGCDSVLTIDLTVNHSSSSAMELTVCDSTELNDEVFTTTGIYTQMLTNTVGCDSVLTIDLTVNQSSSSAMELTVCDSTELNDEIFYSSGTYTQMLTNAVGCDSVLTIDLTVNQSSSSEIELTVCDSTELNDEVFTETGIYTQMLTNAIGCDSLLTIDLTVNKIDVTVTLGEQCLTSNEEGAVYQWINCADNAPIDNETNQQFTSDIEGNYAVIVSKNNCSDTTSCYNLMITGIEHNTFKTELNLYPNPTNENITVNMGKMYDFSVRIKDVSGRTISERSYKNTKQFTTNVNGEKGIYFLEIITNNGKSAILKVLKK